MNIVQVVGADFSELPLRTALVGRICSFIYANNMHVAPYGSYMLDVRSDEKHTRQATRGDGERSGVQEEALSANTPLTFRA